MNRRKGSLVDQDQKEQPFCRNFSENRVFNKWVRSIVDHVLLAAMGVSGLALLPAMMYSRRLRETYYAICYKLCQRMWEKSFAEVRRILVARLDDMVSHSESLRARGAVRVLEVGAAYGPNLQFMRRPVEYWKVEPNTQFDASFLRNLAANPKVHLERSICSYGENMAEVPSGYFDVVLMTYVLCSVKDCRKLLDECKRVLAKGGLLLFSEHVGHPKGSRARFLQDFFTPLTRHLTCGCHMNRDTAHLIRNSGFESIEILETELEISFLFSRQIYGTAEAQVN